ncbi:MAG: PEGA domain-containing protein [Phycisphaerales bacterium]|nr:PEGA domain-containing protein [Phycisphaerales bacterium]
MKPIRLSQAVLVAAALGLAAPRVGAQVPAAPSVESRYQEGADLRERQQDAQALAIFQELYAQTREPRALAQIGMAEGALGRWLDAEQHLSEAIANADAWVGARRQALDSALATMRAHLGQLDVQTSAQGAEVWVDGRRLGSANSPLRVVAGTTSFEVRAAGYASVARVATVPAGGLARESVTLTPTSASGVAPVVPPHVDLATVPSTTAPLVAASGGGTRRTLAIASLVVGGVVLAGGVAAWSYGWSLTSDYNNDPACPAPEAAALPAQCQSRLDSARTMEPLGWTGMLLGAALVTTGAVLLGTAPRESPGQSVRVVSGPGEVGAGLRVEF